MEYRKLNDKYSPSLLGYGCMRFPTNAEGKIDEPRAAALLDRAYEQGVTYYDTAYIYHDGNSEAFVGKTMSKYPRDSYYLATKMPGHMVKTLDDAKKIFENQLKNLQTDYIDFYLLHGIGKGGYDKFAELGVVDYLQSMKDEGKIINYGFSFHDNYEAFEYIIKARHWDFCQIQFNYMDKDTQATMKGYELAKSLGVPFIIMEPVKGGNLANIPDDVMQIVKPYRPDYSPAAWALSWVGSFDNVKVILSGMTTEDQLEDNLRTFNNFKVLSDEEMKAVEKVGEAILARAMNGCTGCRYCMPCPMGVNIPGNFAMWNNYHKYNNRGELEWRLRGLKESEAAENCVKCGKCETLCPQHLSIRDDLERFTAELKALGLK